MRAEADLLLREADKLVSAPSSRLARLMWHAEPGLAAAKFSSAANKFAYCGSTDLAKLCFVKAADCYSETNQHYSAGQQLEKAFQIAPEQRLLLRCGEELALSGQPAAASEAVGRGARKIDDVEAMVAAIDYADLAGATMRSVELARAGVVWLAGRGEFRRALEKAKTVFGMMDGVGIEVSEPTRARLVAAVVVLHLLSSLEDAEASFLGELPDFGRTKEAHFVDDLLAACKARDVDAFKEALKPSRLSLLDFEIAALVRDIGTPSSTLEWWGSTTTTTTTNISATDQHPAPQLEQEEENLPPGEDDDLPDVT